MFTLDQNKFYHSVRLQKDTCTGCTHCLKRCPTQAIRIRDGKAQINEKFCIDCGECIRICPHHAKYTITDELAIMAQYQYTIALPAPALYSQFNNLHDINIVLHALLEMGFDAVFEVSAAAELVSEATRDYLETHTDQYPLISTACPSVVRLIRVKFPNLIPHLLPLNPPVEVAAALAVKKAMQETGLAREQIGVCFLSPCPSKATYAKSPLGIEKSEIDHVFAIKDIYPAILPHMKHVSENPAEIAQSGRIGISWGCRGGEVSGLLSQGCLAADGIENVLHVLEDLEDEKFPTLQFIELNACNGGCVGGVLTVENPYLSKSKLQQLRKYLPVTRSHINGDAAIEAELTWKQEVTYEPVFNLGKTMLESFSLMQKIEQTLTHLPGLDCGSCGAPTCRVLAQDIVKGEATEDACVHVMKEKLNRLLQERGETL